MINSLNISILPHNGGGGKLTPSLEAFPIHNPNFILKSFVAYA